MKLLSLKKTQKFNRSVHAYELFTNKRSKQVFSLYTSTIFGIIIGIGVSVVNTRMLGEKQFGDLKFLQNLFMFVAITINFGMFVTGGRLLAQSKDDAAKPYLVGNIMLITAVIAMFQIVILLIYSYVPINTLSPEIGKMIRMFSPLLFVFPFQLCFESLMQGDNRIYELSFFRLLPSALFLFAAVIVNYYIPVNLALTLLMQLGILTVVIIVFIFKFKPKISHYKQYWPVLFEENKRYGFPVYIGVLAGVATTQLGTISISYLIDNVNLGYFSLAVTISMPLSMIPSVVGTSFFKEYSTKNSVSRKVTIITIILSLFSLFLFLLLIKEIFNLLYTNRFSAAVDLTYIISFGAVLHGFGDYFNRFLGAHGLGKQLRNGAISVGLVNLFGFVVLVYLFGVRGAAITRVLSGLIYFLMMYFAYKQYQHNKVSTKGNF